MLYQRNTPRISRNAVELFKRTKLKRKKQICDNAGDRYQRHKSEITHNDLLLQLIFIRILQKRIADDKCYKRKENIQRKRVVCENGIRKPAEIIFKRVQRRFGQTFPTNKSTDHKHQQKMQNTYGYGAPAF